LTVDNSSAGARFAPQALPQLFAQGFIDARPQASPTPLP
jgi:hypothetical protein